MLELIVSMWDVNDQAFRVGPHVLKIDIDDLYFLNSLSRRREDMIFSAHWDSKFSMEDYIEELCREVMNRSYN